jgi:two-component system nitrate/nitrite response regulator NarP
MRNHPILGMLRRSRDRAFVANGAAGRRTASRPRIVIVDDHPITLAGLNLLLAAHCTVLARCADAQEALRCVRIYEPDMLIIDQDMPAMDGVDVLKLLREAGNQTPVVLLATANNAKLRDALGFKVEGIVFKESDPRRLIRCVREVHAGRQWLDVKVSEAASVVSDGDALDTLTRRQIQVARAAVSGLSNKELAQRLGVSEGTIKNHLHAIYERLRLEGRLALLLYLNEKGPGPGQAVAAGKSNQPKINPPGLTRRVQAVRSRTHAPLAEVKQMGSAVAEDGWQRRISADP